MQHWRSVWCLYMSKIKKRYLLLVGTLALLIVAFGAWLAYKLHEDPYQFKVPHMVGDFGGPVVNSQ